MTLLIIKTLAVILLYGLCAIAGWFGIYNKISQVSVNFNIPVKTIAEQLEVQTEEYQYNQQLRKSIAFNHFYEWISNFTIQYLLTVAIALII